MKKFFPNILLGIFFLAPIFTYAEPTLLFGVWIPYWKKDIGVAETLIQLQKLHFVNLFSFEIDKNGKPKNTLKIEKEPWLTLMDRSKQQNKNVIATFSWFKGTEIDAILSQMDKRTLHINSIIDIAKKYNLNGIDIDYENKLFKSRNAFNAFLAELKTKAAANNLLLYCTIEPRTPLADQYLVIPKNIDYVNDYEVISKNCDKIIIMAYDQRRIDITLNRAKGATEPYVPVSDNDWVRKVIAQATVFIPKEKIILGVPTFGHEYVLEKTKSGKWIYHRVGSLTYKKATEIIQAKNLESTRNNSGEMTFRYILEDEQRLGIYYDHGAIKSKIDLAREFGLSGISLFKIDGESDSSLWNYITN